MTSRVDNPRWTSTLSMTSWKARGVMRAKICRKKDAASVSESSPRYFFRACQNQRMPNLVCSSGSNVRFTVIMRPLHIFSKSVRESSIALSAPGTCSRARFSSILPRSAKRPSDNSAIAGTATFRSALYRQWMDSDVNPRERRARRTADWSKGIPSGENSCLSAWGSDGCWCSRAIMRTQSSPVWSFPAAFFCSLMEWIRPLSHPFS